MRDTTPKPFVFVLMPFKDEFKDVYELGIKAACKAAGAYCERVDEQDFSESMLERIYNQISRADIVVADMTDANPNVFYEVGYAHALGKNTILLKHTKGEIPFDLRHYSHIVYADIASVIDRLKKKVRHYIKYPQNKRPDSYQRLEYLVEGQKLRTEKVVAITAHRGETYQGRRNIKLWSLSFDAHNPTDKPIDVSGIQFGLQFPVEFGEPEGTFTRIMKLDVSSYMYSNEYTPGTITPGGYVHEGLAVVKQFPVTLSGKHLPCSVSVFSESGNETIDFFIVVQEIPDPNVFDVVPGAAMAPPPAPRIPDALLGGEMGHS